MRIITFAIVLGLTCWAGAATAAPPASVDVNDGIGNPAGGVRINCPGDVLYDTGMFDEFTPPPGCATAGSGGCFVNALNEGGFPTHGRRLAEDWPAFSSQPITHVKMWARYNAAGWDYRNAVGGLHGYCIVFHEEVDFECPNGTVPGIDALGPILSEQYSSTFTEDLALPGLVRQSNVCITLDQPFIPQPERIYWITISADFDFVSYAGGVTQWFWRLITGSYDPVCASSWYNYWGTATQNWHETSVAINVPCWAGWNQSLVLYGGEVPPQRGACCFADGSCQVLTESECAAAGGTYQGDGTGCEPNPCQVVPAEMTTWGQIKANYR